MPNRRPSALPDPAGFNALRARIVERYPRLSQQQQAIATFALAHPETMAMETAEQLAKRLDVQPSALVRFAHALDYQGFREMKQRFRANLIFKTAAVRERVAAEPPADDASTGAGGANAGAAALAARFVAQAIEELAQLQRQFDGEALAAGVELLRETRAIYVTAQHLAYPFAALFAWTLIQNGRQCHILDNTGGFALPQAHLAAPAELLVAISLAPYQASVVQAAQAHADRGGKVLAVTDTALSPLAPFASTLIELPQPATAAPSTQAGLACVVQALALAVEQG